MKRHLAFVFVITTLCGVRAERRIQNLQAGNNPQNVSFQAAPGAYPSGLDISWNITAVASYGQVEVRFTNVDVTCSEDSVMIYDGERDWNDPTWTFCGQTDRSYLSTSNRLSVRLRTTIDQLTGFIFTYKQNPYTVCVNNSVQELRVLRNSTKVLFHPGSPLQYFDMLHCRWRIKTYGYYDHIQLEIEVFNIATIDPDICSTDYLVVYNGYDTSNQRFPRICGSNKNQTIVSYNKYLYLEFITDRMFTGQGFMISYTGVRGEGQKDGSVPPAIVGLIIGTLAGVFIMILIPVVASYKQRKKRNRATENRQRRANENRQRRANENRQIQIPSEDSDIWSTAISLRVAPGRRIYNPVYNPAFQEPNTDVTSISPPSPPYEEDLPPAYTDVARDNKDDHPPTYAEAIHGGMLDPSI